jgi:CubicO group peptidase (beta-lactamase class C family)
MRPGIRLLLCAVFLFQCGAVCAQDEAQGTAARVQPLVERAMREGRIPSLTIALVRGDRLLWSRGFGYSNLWAKTQASPASVYLIGSTFKAMSAFALLQQVEKGKLKLDDPVDRYLGGITIRGEFANQPVTFRHLLTHTSGLPTAFGPRPVWGESVPSPLADYLRGGILRISRPPMARFEYSNVAFTLLAYLLERVTGTEFRTHIRRHIFAPLEMTSTEFEPRPDMDERLAVPYVPDPRSGRNTPVARARADVWPAGIVYGTVQDMANWLIVNLNGGEFRGKRLLRPDTLAEMHRRQFEKFGGPTDYGFGNETTGYGLAWLTSVKAGERYFAHSGSVAGYTAFLVGNLNRRTGCAVLTNGHKAHRQIASLAEEALAAVAP